MRVFSLKPLKSPVLSALHPSNRLNKSSAAVALAKQGHGADNPLNIFNKVMLVIFAKPVRKFLLSTATTLATLLTFAAFMHF